MFRVLSKQPRFYFLRSRFFSNDRLSVLQDDSTMKRFHIQENLEQASFMKAIKKASFEKESLQSSIVNSSAIQAMTLSDNKYEFDDNSIMPSTLYIRDFYSRLLDSLLSTKNSILLGNPGVSKSMFQWYIIQRLVSEGRYELIIRQVGDEKFTFFFPGIDKVYECPYNTFLLRNVITQRNYPTLYLFEPEMSLIEPFSTKLPTIITCSPDRARYHEFLKRGGIRNYMPCWKLDELLLVGAHVAKHCDSKLKDLFKPEAIEKRFDQFGGIFRYVIPSSKLQVVETELLQRSVFNGIRRMEVFLPGNDIEKVDDNKKNISHFALQYKVSYEGENKGAPDEFQHFKMDFASLHAKQYLTNECMSPAELSEGTSRLQLMFIGGLEKESLLFEMVVLEALRNSTLFKWNVYVNGTWYDHQWKFDKSEDVAKHDENVLKMKPGILYRPVDRQFPIVDFLFVKESPTGRQIFGVQITFAQKHAKKKETYERLYQRLGMKKSDKLHIYIVPSPQNAQGYAELQNYQYFTPQSKDNKLDVDFITVRSEFDPNYVK